MTLRIIQHGDHSVYRIQKRIFYFWVTLDNYKVRNHRQDLIFSDLLDAQRAVKFIIDDQKKLRTKWKVIDTAHFKK